MSRLPIYLVTRTVVDGIPPERIYSTHDHNHIDSLLLGHVVSEHPLEPNYQGVAGVSHRTPHLADAGFYSIPSLLMSAMVAKHGLAWVAAGAAGPAVLPETPS